MKEINRQIKSMIGAIIVAATVGVQEASQAAIIRSSNFESGNFSGVGRQFQKKTCSTSQSHIDNSLFDLVTDKTRDGKYAIKHHIKNCDERSELVGAPAGFFKTGQEYWIGWSYLFPKNFIKPVKNGATYTIVHQMFYDEAWVDQDEGKTIFQCSNKGYKNGVYRSFGAPGNEMTITPDGKKYHYKLQFFKGKDSQGRNIFDCQSFEIPVVLEKWEDFVMNVKFSDKSSNGFVKLWKNGQLYMDRELALLPPGEIPGSWKVGAYVGDPGNGERTVYIDELKIGDAKSNYKEVSSPGVLMPVTPASFNLAQARPLTPENLHLAQANLPYSSSVRVPEPSIIGGLIVLGAGLLLKKINA